MPRTPKVLLAGLVLVGLLQSVALAKIVYDRVTLLKTGREVILALAPRDPRDPFLGYYSRLSFGISRIDTTNLMSAADATALRADPSSSRQRDVYVGLKQSQARVFEPVSVSLAMPAPQPDVIVARGRTRSLGSGNEMWIDYGIESFYLPKDQAAALDLKQSDTLRMVVAVGPDGEMAIKRLLVNGEPAYEEMPF